LLQLRHSPDECISVPEECDLNGNGPKCCGSAICQKSDEYIPNGKGYCAYPAGSCVPVYEPCKGEKLPQCCQGAMCMNHTVEHVHQKNEHPGETKNTCQYPWRVCTPIGGKCMLKDPVACCGVAQCVKGVCTLQSNACITDGLLCNISGPVVCCGESTCEPPANVMMNSDKGICTSKSTSAAKSTTASPPTMTTTGPAPSTSTPRC